MRTVDWKSTGEGSIPSGGTTINKNWAVGIDGNTVALQASVPGSIPGRSTSFFVAGIQVIRQSHKLGAEGSSPSPASTFLEYFQQNKYFHFWLWKANSTLLYNALLSQLVEEAVLEAVQSRFESEGGHHKLALTDGV